MDNPDNINNPLNPISNSGIFSQNNGSPMKNPNNPRNFNQYLYSQSPYPSKGPLFNTPNKFYEGRSLFPPLGETPMNCNMFMNFPISPFNNNRKIDISLQNSQNIQKNSDNYFKNFISPYYTDKKNDCKNYLENNGNEYGEQIRGINLNEKFNDYVGKEGNEKNIYDNRLNDNNRKDSEFMNNILDKDDEYNVKKNNKKKKYKNQGIKNFLFGDNSSPNHDIKIEKLENENVNEIQEDKVATVIVEDSILDGIKNVFGNNLSKKEYIFNSMNGSVISNFSFSPNDTSSLSQNQFSLPNPQSQYPNQTLRSNKKLLKNTEVPTYVNSSTNNSSTTTKCTCKNSNCFKLYCECFANGRFCDNCSCVNCQNTLENKELRNQKYDEIIAKNPKALQKINSTKRSWTCKCKNSNCLKKYCDCLQNGRSCTSKCKCINCFNKNVTYNRSNGGERKYKTKRIRGIKKNIINSNKIIEENNENEINEEHEDEIDEDNKKKIVNLSTPKKSKNYLDKNEIYFYYDKNQSSTAAMTNKKERRKMMSTRTESKNKNIYTKLQMD